MDERTASLDRGEPFSPPAPVNMAAGMDERATVRREAAPL